MGISRRMDWNITIQPILYLQEAGKPTAFPKKFYTENTGECGLISDKKKTPAAKASLPQGWGGRLQLWDDLIHEHKVAQTAQENKYMENLVAAKPGIIAPGPLHRI